ncbi:MAG: D-alanine--D-alanine ligase [Spirochaetales bacterium]|nr:D-alanine--D-alanine ligase [Spirochaetales bacterium]
MTKKNICILYGGKSGEHEVSKMSAASVATHLDPEKYSILMIGIEKNGKWYLQPEALQELKAGGVLNIAVDESMLVSVIPGVGFSACGDKMEIDFVFPVLHGTFGEDGTIQGLLELSDLPYAGAGVMGSSVGMDKEIIKKIWLYEGLDTVPFASLNSEQADSKDFSFQTFALDIDSRFGYPVFIKPVRAGSSVGISKVNTADKLEIAVRKALRFDNRVMIEPAVDAREVECSVIGNMNPLSFAPGEVAPTHDFYDYEAKYIDENGAALIIPADLPPEMTDRVRKTAVKAYSAAGIEGMARVDFFIDRKSGKLLLNEVNTIPGFTSISMFSKMCEAGGLPYPLLLDRLIELGQQRFETKNSLHFSLED